MRSGGFQEEPSSANHVTVAFGEFAQLTKRMRPPAATFRNDDSRPQALGTRQLNRVAGAGPAAGA